MSASEYECDRCGESFDTPGALGGHKRAHEMEIAEEDLLEEIERVADDLGRQPTQEEMGRLGKYSIPTYQNRFGSWSEALREVGREPYKRSGIPDEELLAAIRDLADELGRPPKQQEMQSRSPFSHGVYPLRFGSWTEALEAAGLTPADYRKVPREKLLDDLEAVAEIVGHRPGATSIREHGRFSVQAYFSEFGSLKDARESAGFSRRQPYPEGQDHPQWQGGYRMYVSVRRSLRGQAWDTIRAEQLADECYMCGATDSLELHHIIPVLAGGTNDAWNLMTLCSACHRTTEGHTRRFTDRCLVPGPSERNSA